MELGWTGKRKEGDFVLTAVGGEHWDVQKNQSKVTIHDEELL